MTRPHRVEPPRPGVGRSARLALAAAAAACLAWGLAGPARAQSVGVDPYDPWTYQYRASIYPGAVGLSALPNQARIASMPSTSAPLNLDNPFSDQAAATRAGGRFVPYYARNYRNPDRARNAVTPNGRETSYVANANDTFYQRQQDRDRRFFEALRERDPRKRAQLLREIDRPTSLTDDRPASRRTTGTSAAAAAATTAAFPTTRANPAALAAPDTRVTPPIPPQGEPDPTLLPEPEPDAPDIGLPLGRILPRSQPINNVPLMPALPFDANSPLPTAPADPVAP
jgi:hypothetical protein